MSPSATEPAAEGAAPQNGPQKRRRIDPRVFLFLTPIMWGVTFPASKLVLTPDGPLSASSFMFWTRTLGAIAVVVTMPLIARSDFTRANLRRALIPCLALGALIAVGYTLQTLGIQRTTATNAGLITGMYVVLTPLVLWVVFRTKITRVVWVTVAASLVGLALLSMPTFGLSLPSYGDLLVFLGTCGWTIHVIWIGRFAERYPATVLAAGQMLVTALIQLLIGIPAGLQASEAASVWGLLLITGVIGSGLGYTFQAMAQREVSAGRAAVVLAGESLVAAVASYFWLGERLLPHQLLGAFLIVGAMIWSEIRASRPESSRLDPFAAP